MNPLLDAGELGVVDRYAPSTTGVMVRCVAFGLVPQSGFVDSLSRLAELTRPTGAEERLDVSYPRPRIAVSVPAACAVAALCAVALIGWIVWSRYSQGTDQERAAFVEEWPAAVAPASSSASPTELVVAVVGHVSRSGLITVEPHMRVADALDLAKPLPGAQVEALGLARRLSDGEQIVVPPPGAEVPTPSAEGTTDSAMISLNTADAEELQALDGVGEVTATAIVEYRESIGGFTDIAQLQEVSGIGPKKYEAIAGKVRL